MLYIAKLIKAVFEITHEIVKLVKHFPQQKRIQKSIRLIKKDSTIKSINVFCQNKWNERELSIVLQS